MQLSPDNALLLNFLGYGKLERGEDLDAAEAMVRRASALRPEDASITDSLGWAQYKRGKVDEAIVTLQRAADKDPDQPMSVDDFEEDESKNLEELRILVKVRFLSLSQFGMVSDCMFASYQLDIHKLTEKPKLQTVLFYKA